MNDFNQFGRRINSPGQRQYYEGAMEQVSRAYSWDFNIFRRVCLLGVELGNYPARVPSSISLGPLQEALEKLASFTFQDDRERARVGFIQLEKQQFLLGPMQTGEHHGVNVAVFLPRHSSAAEMKHVMLLHSHPASVDHGLHLSGEDFQYLLRFPSVMASAVIHRDRILLALKTSGTPHTLDETALGQAMAGFLGQPISPGSSPKAHVIRFNLEVCRRYGLALFVSQPGAPEKLLRVKLGASETGG